MAAAAPADEYKPQTKLVSCTFVNSVAFGGESQSVQVGRNVDSITPARMEGDGVPVGVDKGQRADGVLLRMKRHDRVTGRKYVAMDFVPWSNIRSLSYGD